MRDARQRNAAWGAATRKMQNWKKAIVTLKEGDAIDFFDAEKAE